MVITAKFLKIQTTTPTKFYFDVPQSNTLSLLCTSKWPCPVMYGGTPGAEVPQCAAGSAVMCPPGPGGAGRAAAGQRKGPSPPMGRLVPGAAGGAGGGERGWDGS